MSITEFEGLDPARTRLRATIATIEGELARLPRPAASGEGQSALAASFADLVGQLALGPEPETRACPVCHHLGMRAATICGHCWTKLTPPGHTAAVG